MQPREIAQLLAQDAESAARYLLPNGKRQGHEWRAGSISGDAGESLGVHLTGAKTGIWADFANGDARGDLLDLWAQCRRIGIPEAMREAAEWLGIKPASTGKPFAPGMRKFTRPAMREDAKTPEISDPAMDWLTFERAIPMETLEAYKILVIKGNVIVFPYYRGEALVFVKYRQIPKKIWSEKDAEPALFGWQAVPDSCRSVVLVEGEMDALAMHAYGIPALSVPFGGGTGEKQAWIETEWDNLDRFDEIILCLDPDEAGKAATKEIAERLGLHRVRFATLPEKDANACLMAVIPAETVRRCIRDAESMDPEELRRAADYVDEIIEQFSPSQERVDTSLRLPWARPSDLALRESELIVLNGINGHGKSQICGQIALETVRANHRICIASMEMSPRRLLERMARQAGGIRSPSADYIRAIHRWYGDRLWLFDLVGTAKVQRLMDVLLYARKRYGIGIFIIDSLMKCGIAEDDYNGQKAFMERLADFKNTHGCTVIIVTHSRKGQSEDLAPGKWDVKGSGSITDLADTVLTVWRNKRKEKAIEEGKSDEAAQWADSKLIVSKQRNGEWEGEIKMGFDRESMQYKTHSEARAWEYVPFSNDL